MGGSIGKVHENRYMNAYGAEPARIFAAMPQQRTRRTTVVTQKIGTIP
jgi:hypothetical protein